MAGPDDGGVATAAVADAAGASGGSNTPLDQARSAANDVHVTAHHPAGSGAADGGGADEGEHHSSSSTPQHPHPHQHQQPQAQSQSHPANGGGEGVRPQTHLSETAPSWSAADERHAAAHAHEEATARTADAVLRGRAGTPVETQITSDEEAGTSSDDEQRGGNGSGSGGGGTDQAQPNNNNQSQQQQGGEQLLAAKALAAVAATAGVRAAKQQQQQQWNMAGVHRSRAGNTASSTAGSGMGIGMAAAAEEMSVVLPEELRSVLEEVAKSGQSNQLPWMVTPGDAADTAMESAAVEKGVETEDIPVPFPFCGIESRRKRKRLPHTSTADGGAAANMKGQGESDFGSSPCVGRKRPRPTPGNDLAGERIYLENDENDYTAKESTSPAQFRTLRNVLQVSLALVLDGAYRVCSEWSGIGYRACQAEREAWDRKQSGGTADTHTHDSTDNLVDGVANGSHAAMENGSSSSDGIAGISPARPVEAMGDDEEKKASVVSPSDLDKEMYLDRRAKLLAMLNVEQEGSRGNRKRRGAMIPPEEYGPVEPPFTIQRICEILVEPTKYYSQTHKLCNALEKLLLITSPEGSFGGAKAAGEDEEEGRYDSGSIPEEEDLDLRKIVGRDPPTKIGGDAADTELPLQFSSQQHNEEYRRHIQEQRQNQSAALTSAASSSLNDRFAFASSSSGGSGSRDLDIDRDSHLASIEGGEHVGAEASTLDARSEQELRQTISSSLEGAGTEIAPGHLIARAPSPVLFANGTNSSASTDHRVIGMRGEGLGDASAAAARQQGSSRGIQERSGSVEAAESIDFMVASRSRASALQRQQDRGAPDTAALRDVDGQTGHLSASNSEDGDVDDSMESGDDLSIDDSASDRSDRSDRSDGADSDTGSHIPTVASGSGLPGTGLSIAAMGTSLHAVGTSAPAPYGYEPFAAARVLALNRIHQQQQRQEQFLQSRALAAVAAGAHAAASAANAPPGVGQQSGLSSSIGLGAAQQHQHLGAHNNFRPPPDSEYQSGDSIDSTRAEDSCESDSSASDMND